MNKDIVEFLADFKSDSNRIFTHVSMISPNSRFVIDGDNIEEFMETYSSLLFEHGGDFVAGIAERYQECLPILVDVDISFENDGNIDINRKLYTENEVKKLIQIYNKTLKSIIKNIKDQDLVAFVLEKPHPVIVGTKVKGAGFHIHYPKIWLRKMDHEVHLLPRVIERVKQEKIFDSLKIPIADKSTLIDTTYVNKCWLMYGSRKDPSQYPYTLTNIYNHKLEPISLFEAVNNYPIHTVDGEEIKYEKDFEDRKRGNLKTNPLGRNGIFSEMKTINTDEYLTDKGRFPANIIHDGSEEVLNIFSGIGTTLKPACEPIVLARKPIVEDTIALNVLKYGTGGLNIDDCHPRPIRCRARRS